MTALNERARKQVEQMLAQTRRDVEAGKLDWADEKARTVAYSLPPSDFASHRAIEAFAAALREVRTAYHALSPDAVAVEREACAKVADENQLPRGGMLSGTGMQAVHDGCCLEIAAAIRARSEP